MGRLFFTNPLIVFLFSCPTISAQTDSTDVCQQLICKSSTILIPVVYYTPETRLAGGAGVLHAFRLKGQPESQRPSQFQFGAVYTQNKQILFYLPFQIFSNNEKFQIKGELGYFKFIFKFFDIGNETDKNISEFYDADFPRLRLNGLYQFKPNWYAGLRYWWDDFKIPARDSTGILIKNNITGSEGGVVSGIGPIINYDTRNSLFYPTDGVFVEAELFLNKKAIGSDFNFTRFSIDATKYFPIKEKSVFALNAYLVHINGDPPFQQLAQIGGPKKMRGYFEGRFRDNHLWTLQTAYRFPLFWRLGGTVFTAAGNVSPEFKNLFSQKVHFTYGVGLRILLSKKDNINLRLDVGANEQGGVFPYLTVGEAF